MWTINSRLDTEFAKIYSQYATTGIILTDSFKQAAFDFLDQHSTNYGVHDEFFTRFNPLWMPLALDIREKTGSQPFVKEVPVNLIYVADYAKITRASDTSKDFYSAADAAFIAENVYLFCASEGLSTVVRGSVDRTALAQVMKLRPEQKVILAQSVGYPKK